MLIIKSIYLSTLPLYIEEKTIGSLAQADHEEFFETQQNMEIEIDGVEIQLREGDINVVDDLAAFQEGQPAAAESTATKTNRQQIADLFDASENSMITVRGVTVWVEFLPNFSGGTFAHVHSADKKALLGVLKSTTSVFSSLSLQALCKVHKPAGSCKCWITFSDSAKRKAVFEDLLEWFGKSRAGQEQHMENSSSLRKSYGMRIRK